jgi:hypothetical protein
MPNAEDQKGWIRGSNGYEWRDLPARTLTLPGGKLEGPVDPVPTTIEKRLDEFDERLSRLERERATERRLRAMGLVLPSRR